MTEDAITPEEYVEEALPDRLPNPPCEIHMLNGKSFIVTLIDGWNYVPQGIFARGRFKGYTGDKEILIPADRIDYIDLDYVTLRRTLQGALAAQEAAVAEVEAEHGGVILPGEAS